LMISAKTWRSMGRYYWDKKGVVEDCTELSVFKLKEFGLLNGCCSSTLTWTRQSSGHKNSIGIYVNVIDEPCARVKYTITDRQGEKTDYDYQIQMTTTPCHLAGVRYWFICPLVTNDIPCGRRVAKLYIAPGARYFGCRDCLNLSYESRNEPRLARPGGIGYLLKLDRQIEDLSGRTKRWTYGGRLTRKARKLRTLEQRITKYF